MAFGFDGDPQVKQVPCDTCGGHIAVSGFVLRDGDAYAVYFADWHAESSEAFIDVIFGSFEGPEYADHVTFGCRVGHVPSQVEPACSAVAAAALRHEAPIFGQKLDREEALAHARVDDFWAVVDWLIVNDPTLHEHVYHMPPAG